MGETDRLAYKRGGIMRKKVLFVVMALKSGGAERVVNTLSNELVKKDIEVNVLAFSEESPSYNLSERVNVFFEPLTRMGTLQKRITRIKAIRRLINEKQIDTVIAFSHYNNMSAVIAALGLKVNVIISERSDPAQLDSKRMLKMMRNLLYRWADKLVCQTEDAKNYFSSTIQEKSIVILNPLSECLPDPFSGTRKKTVVSFARLEKAKNFPMLIEAFEKLVKQYKDYDLYIYGNGSQKVYLENLIKEKDLGAKIHLCPFVDKIHEKILDAEIFVLPSNYEGLSNSMLEAMAIGLPVIVTDCPCGGARMVIKDHENGILTPVGDSEQLYLKMKELIENKELAETIGKNAIRLREKLAPGKICNQWLEIIGS